MPNLLQLASGAVDARTFTETVRGYSKAAWYSTAPTAVPAAAGIAVPGRISIEARSHFFATGIVGKCFITATLIEVNFETLHAVPTIQITDEGSNSTWFDRPTLWTSVVGVAERPFRILPAQFCEASHAIRVDFAQTAGIVGMTMQLALTGYKVYLV